MTPKERMTAFAKGEPMDRIPVVPDMGVTKSEFIGVTTKEYYHSAERMAELEIALFDYLHHDSIGISTTLRGMAEAMGSKIGYPEDNISYLLEPVVKDFDDVDRLEPADPRRDGKLPLLLKALEIIKDTLGDVADIGASMTGPFSVAASVVGTENLLKWMVRAPEKVHQVMEVITESNDRYIEAVAQLGLGVGFCDPVSSTSVISPKQFRSFSLPYMKRNVAHVAECTGGRPTMHICGKSRDLWEDCVEAGIGNFSIDNVEDLEDAKNVMGDRVVITGNIPPVDVVANGTVDDVFRSARECIRKAWDSPKGFILCTGCQIPKGTPMENIKAIMDAGREYGRLPIRPELLED
nr:uroporphyrinogen decarboxylase family protein [Dethiosulfovibrio faecalis]